MKVLTFLVLLKIFGVWYLAYLAFKHLMPAREKVQDVSGSMSKS